MRILATLVFVAGCYPASSPGPTPGTRDSANTRPVQADDGAKRKLSAFVARAEQALADDLRLDYERPFAKKSLERPETVELLLEACRAGEKPWCWKAASIAPKADRMRLYEIVAANCRAGDNLSCRALPDELDVAEPLYADLPGALGRSQCSGMETTCDIPTLERECTAGFGLSCYVASTYVPGNAKERLVAQQDKNYKQDCLAGIERSCFAISNKTADEELQIYASACAISREGCALLGDLYDAKQQPLAARDARERGCQFGKNPTVCATLGAAYLDHKYEEPVPGRGRALLDDSCRKLGTYAARVDECKRASK